MLAWIKSKIPFEIFINVISWALAIMIIGLYDFVDFDIVPENILKPEFWQEALTLLMLGVMLFSVATYLELINIWNEDKKAQQYSQEIEDSLSDFDMTDLPKFIHELNIERRIKVYKQKTNNKRTKLIEKASEEDKDLWFNGDEDKKLNNRFCKKMKNIEWLLSDEYINKHRTQLPAKFIRITEGFIQTGSNHGQRSPVQNPSKPFWQTVKDNSSSFIVPVIISATFFTTAYTRSDEDNYAMLIVVAVKLIVLLFNYINGVRYADKLHKTSILGDLKFRHGLLYSYLNEYGKLKKSMKKDSSKGGD